MNSTRHIHSADIPLAKRITAYLAILSGYFFYCYNFVVVDYLRPYLVESYHFSLSDTALFYTAQSIGALLGAILIAQMAESWGRKKSLVLITLCNGLGTLCCLYTQQFTWWILLRFMIGFSLGGYFTVSIAIMVGLFDARVRARITSIAASLFSIALIAMGALGSIVGAAHWSVLLWVGALPPMISAFLILLSVPDDRRVIPFGNNSTRSESQVVRGNWLEMLQGRNAKFTILCVLMAGLNFSGYQFFSGFVTTYLLEVRHFSHEMIGAMISAEGAGSLVGAYLWGYIADTFGRKANAFGFWLAALMICIYFIAPSSAYILGICGFMYGLGLGASSVWGAYFTELFPEHLRSMGASLFHAGHIIAFLAPSAVTLISRHYDLTTGMWGAPVIYALAALCWMLLPETLKRKDAWRKLEQPAENL